MLESAVILEYFGLAGDPEYDRMTEKKTRVYADNGIAMLPVYRRHLGRGIEDYVMGGVEKMLHDRHDRFRAMYRCSGAGPRSAY